MIAYLQIFEQFAGQCAVPLVVKMEVTGPIAARLSELFKEIAECVAPLAGKWGIQIIASEVMPDHVHLFVSALPKYSPAKLAQLFKGTTSYVLRLEFPEIKQAIWKAGAL